jgi:outer membrane protein assembly factor BamB
VAINTSNGRQAWLYSDYGGGGGYSGPVTAPGKVIFAGTASAFVTCLDPNDKNTVKFRCLINGGMDESVPALYGDKMIVYSRNGYIFCIK